MTTFLLTLVALALLMGIMSIGVVFSGRRLRGSCGGQGGDDCFCEANGIEKPEDCPRDNPPERPTSKLPVVS